MEANSVGTKPLFGTSIRCNHVLVSVGDLEQMVDWYTDKLDLQLVRRFEIPDEQAKFALLQGSDGGLMFELAHATWTEPNPNAFGDQKDLAKVRGLSHFAFEVDDCAATEEELKRRGVNIVKPTHDAPDAGMRCAFFHDPEGNVFELVEPLAV